MFFLFIPIKQIERIKRNNPPVGMDDVHAGFLDAAHVEVMRIQKLHDDHAENVVVRDVPRHRNLRQTAEQLPQRQREVLVLRYWSGLAEAEIAAALGIRPGTVKSTASRALTALETKLGDLR